MALNDVKEILIPSPDDIPGYTRVEYVQSTNNDCSVDLGFIPTTATKIDLDFMITKCNYTGWSPFFGVRGANTNTYFAGFINGTSTKFSPNYGGFDPGNNSTVTISLNVKHNIRNNAGTFYFDNTFYSVISTTNTLVTSTQTFSLFCTHNTDGYYTRNIEMRVYSLKIYEGSSLIRNLVPVKNSSNVYGLYDLVNSVFYTPVEANPLLGGNELSIYPVSKIEDSNGKIIWGSQSAFPYRRLEYIESTDNSAKGKYCIKLDFGVNFTSSSTSHLDFDFQLTKATFNQSSGQYYGAVISSSNLDTRICYSDNYTSSFKSYWSGSGTSTTITSYAWNTNKHSYGIYRGNFYIDGTQRGSCGTGNATYLSLFAQKYNNTEWSILGKFYELSMWNTGQPYLHRLYPAQRKSDNALGVFDTVTGRFYTNSGTGVFTAGPVVDEYWDLTSPS